MAVTFWQRHREPRGAIHPLTEDELVERLCLTSLPLVEAIYSVAQRQLLMEKARSDSLTTKAGTLLGAVGLALTIASTFSGKLLIENYDLVGRYAPLYLLGLITGFVASLLAWWAQRVRGDNRRIDEQAVFNRDELRASETEGDIRYKRYLTAHVWQVARSNGLIQDDRARKIQRGQDAFAVFLFIFAVLWVLVTGKEIASHCRTSIRAPALACLVAQPPTRPDSEIGQSNEETTHGYKTVFASAKAHEASPRPFGGDPASRHE